MKQRAHLFWADRIDPKIGRPSLEWDNQKWQDFFTLLKSKATLSPSSTPWMTLPPLNLRDGENYQGSTDYQNYCRYINDVLSTIRQGQEDFCYYIYQIVDLYRYEPGLKTEFCGGDKLSPYIRVWLEKEDSYGTR